jgi:putative transposase
MIMPDHVHLFAQPSAHNARQRAAWLKMWKSVSARQLCSALGATPPLWQADTFDHILRSTESYSAKWDYVLANPVRAGLVQSSHLWPWQGEIHSLAFR